MAHGDVEFELEADSSSKSAWWLKSEISLNLPASSPVTTSGSVTKSVFRLGGMVRRRWKEAALERARAVCSADPGAEHEGVAAVEGDGWLEVDRSRRVRHVVSGESPYLARQLSVF
jgi:hypothetical protein